MCLFLTFSPYKKENMWGKGRVFDKNHGLTPLQNFEFLDFIKTSPFRFKKHFVFLQNIKKCFFVAFFLKRKIRERGRFFDKNHGLRPLQKSIFWTFLELLLVRSKKDFVLSRISKTVSFWLSVIKKRCEKRSSFVYKNHGLTTLQNLDFFRLFLELHFLGLKSILFYLEYQKRFFSGFLFWKQTYEKNANLLTKIMD